MEQDSSETFHVEQSQKIKIFELPNGTKVILSAADSSASYIGLFVASGSREDEKHLGVSHLIEHAIFKGTSKHSYSDLMNIVESVGGEMNAYTAKEETCFQIAIANNYVERAFSVLSEIFFDSIFPEEELEKEKTVVIDEIESYEDVPSEMIYDDFEENLFAGHSLATNILGTKKSVMKMKREDLLKMYKKLYVPNQLVVSYVGSEDLEKISKLVEKYFVQSIENQLDNINKIQFVPRETIFNLEKNKHTHQAHCVLGSFAPSMKNELKYATSLLTNILGGVSFNALLNLKLREEKGLTYNIEANYNAYSDIGVFAVYFGTDYSKVTTCRQVIAELFDDIIKNGFSDEQLSAYKKQILGQLTVTDDNYMSLMLNNAKSVWWFNHVDSLEEVTEKINSITNEMVKEVAKMILLPENINVLIYK